MRGHDRRGPFVGAPLALSFLAHLAASLWIFRAPLFRGAVLYLRDLPTLYLPDYAFLERALGQGVWPWWYPDVDAGRPMVMAYPLDAFLVSAFGATRTLVLSPAAHVWLALCGATLLGRRLGFGGWASWLAGAAYGLSGYVLSAGNLFPYLEAAAWMPWVIAAVLGFLEAPSFGRAALAGGLGALQVSTLGAEVVLQTMVAAMILGARRLDRRHLRGLFGLATALALAMPVLLATRAMVADTARGAGFSPRVGLGWSASLAVLAESVVPHFLGEVHTFSDLGFWGQPFFPDGYPYFLSLYLGPCVIGLALLGRSWRLLAMAALGVLLSLGENGPLPALIVPLFRHMRTPVKFFLLTTLAAALLAAAGLERARRAGRRRQAFILAVPGLVLLAAALVLFHHPDLVGRLAGQAAAEARLRFVAEHTWPRAFAVTGGLCLAGALALLGGRRLAPLAGLVAALDLLIVNGPLNLATDASFYELRPPMKTLVERARSQGTYRWFSYGTQVSPPLRWDPRIAGQNSDVWLYYLDRQALVPRSHVLDGLEGAYDEDRTGTAPRESTLPVWLRRPELFRQIYFRLRLANVRWLVSFAELPADLVEPFGQVRVPEVEPPLRVFELRDALPRAFWVPAYRVVASKDGAADELRTGFDPRRMVLLERAPPVGSGPEGGPAGESQSAAVVTYSRLDPHTVTVDSTGPPGLIVILDGFDEGWRAEDASGEVPVLRANVRYRALPTRGGRQHFTLRYRPGWWKPSMAAMLGGLLLLVAGPFLDRRSRKGA